MDNIDDTIKKGLPHCEAHSGIVNELKNLAHSSIRQQDLINKLQNRPPVWATLLISILTFALGASMTYASLAMRMAEMRKGY